MKLVLKFVKITEPVETSHGFRNLGGLVAFCCLVRLDEVAQDQYLENCIAPRGKRRCCRGILFENMQICKWLETKTEREDKDCCLSGHGADLTYTY